MAKEKYINRGESGRKVMPFSEACMSMKVAGKEMDFQVQENGMVQLLEDGKPFSSSITSGEAGLYDNLDNTAHYFYYPTE